MNSIQSFEACPRQQLAEWFAPDVLEFRRIGTDADPVILSKLIKYEAVHQVRSMAELLRRLQRDRRCFGLFHPALPLEPLVFTEVALTTAVNDSVQPLLDPESPVTDPADARYAVFYSISNCHAPLRGLGLGTVLLLRAIDDLQNDLPQVRGFSTLSPIPGFRDWLAAEARQGNLTDAGLAPAALDGGWPRDAAAMIELKEALVSACARYLLHGRRGREAADPVARFHLGNGARLERLNWLGDVSNAGMRRSAGMTVNYRYLLRDVARNQHAYVQHGTIAASAHVRQLANA